MAAKADYNKELESIKLEQHFDLDKLDEDSLEALLQLAESSERYYDMATFAKYLVELKLAKQKDGEAVLTADQRNLFSVAYKNVVGTKRQALRILSEQKENNSESANLDEKERNQYKNTMAKELYDWCKEILTFLEKLVEKSEALMKKFENKKDDTADGGKEAFEKATESTVFYKKMIGDYYRYLTEEFKDEQDLKTSCEQAYNGAMKIAKDHLPATNSTRLGLALNFSVAYYEIMAKKEEACTLAKEAFDAAIEKLDSLNDAHYKDSTLIMQLLRDNLTIWSTEKDGAEEPAS